MRHPGIAPRHEGGTLFVFDQHAAHLRIAQLIVDRQDMGAGHAEDDFDAEALQAHPGGRVDAVVRIGR